MSRYRARFAWRKSSTSGEILFHAADDQEALEELRDFVANGVRGETWAELTTRDGERYRCANDGTTTACVRLPS